jgi:tRNA(Ile)-lysidine synthase
MSPFLESLSQGLKLCKLENQKLLVAVSGGADSVALLRGLLELQSRNPFEILVGHLNHQLRGAESQADADWLNNLCDQLNVPIIQQTANVAALSAERSETLEESARKIRYEFLQQTANEHACQTIITAHTADDQVETILHHIIRGTGLSGLRGMQTVRKLRNGSTLARPMLDISRQQVENYLAEIKQDYRQDISNQDESFTRNRIRHSLLPLLEDNYNTNIRQSLLRLGKIADDSQSTIETLAAELLEKALEERTPEICRLNCAILQKSPRHLVREALRILWAELNWPRQKMGFQEWDRLYNLIQTEGVRQLPGKVEACRRGNLLILSKWE